MKREEEEALDIDVLVIGAGAAGLSAAIAAFDFGSTVTLLEKTGRIGGTMSVSYGDIWTPCNDYMKDLGIEDNEGESLKYLSLVSSDSLDAELARAYVQMGAEAIRHLVSKTPLKLSCSRLHDYHSELAGATSGRTLSPELFDASVLGGLASKVRTSPYYRPFSVSEIQRNPRKENARSNKLKTLSSELAKERAKKNIRALGSALACMLLKACLDRGIETQTEVDALAILTNEKGRVTGVSVNTDGEKRILNAKRAVIVSTGGFDWNENFKKDFIHFPNLVALSPPAIQGDGLRLCMGVGAALSFRGEGLLAPAISIDGERFEGKSLYRFEGTARMQPGAIVVNRSGERFVNEATNYHDFVKALFSFNPRSLSCSNLPCWIVFDEKHRRAYGIGEVVPNRPNSEWVQWSVTIRDLANKTGIAAESLASTIKRFNKFALRGVDDDFHRGESAHDIDWSDASHKPNPSLGTIRVPPFYALELKPALFGTAGGVKINPKAQVINWKGDVIPGLYACGSVTAFPFGQAYPASGAALGNAIFFGYIAGKTASRNPPN